MVFLGRKGYFFVVDAIIAATILLFGLLYLFGTGVSSPSYAQTYTATEDFASILLYTSLTTSTNSYYLSTLLPANVVPYPDATPIEEIGYLLEVNPATCPSCASYATPFAQSLMDDTLEQRYGGAIYVNNTLVYSRNIPQKTVFINRSVIVYVRYNATILLGPVRGDVLVWY